MRWTRARRLYDQPDPEDQGQLTKFAGAKIPPAEATTVNAMIAGVQDLLVCDFKAVTTTTTIPTTTTRTTTATFHGACDERQDCQACMTARGATDCVNNPDCTAYWDCLAQGGTDCDSTYPAGASLYNALVNCIQAECPTTCS